MAGSMKAGFSSGREKTLNKSSPRERETEPAESSKARVMVVEDAPSFQELVVLTLTLEPYIKVAYIADSGEEALEEFARVSPDLVLLDFRLPGINGLETARRMKDQNPNVKIALVTAYSEEVLERTTQIAYVDEVIPKSSFSLGKVRRLLDLDS